MFVQVEKTGHHELEPRADRRTLYRDWGENPLPFLFVDRGVGLRGRRLRIWRAGRGWITGNAVAATVIPRRTHGVARAVMIACNGECIAALKSQVLRQAATAPGGAADAGSVRNAPRASNA